MFETAYPPMPTGTERADEAWMKSFIEQEDLEMKKGKICDKHKVGYLSKCPTCESEKNYKKDKHTYRQFKREEG